MKKIIFLLGTLFFILILFFGYKQYDLEDQTAQTYIDCEPLKKIIKVSEMKECYWQTGRVGKTSRLSVGLGPSDVFFRGYIKLDAIEVDHLSKQFQWSKGNITPKFQYKDKSISFKWHESKEFNEKVINGAYAGKVYLDMSTGILYFDLTTI